MKQVEIPIVTRMQDNGDGGYTCYMYPTEDDMIDDHPANENGDITDERREQILDEYDPYEDGYVGCDTLFVLIDEDGNISLDPSRINSIHCGQ